jgi:simple sugar transport system ATP-binding protein
MELRGVCKQFGNVAALTDVDFTVNPAEVVGLVGDNGAGKSTLIKIMTGYCRQDSGDVVWKDTVQDEWSIQAARDSGIETVYQERALCDKQALWRNIFMGRELTSHGLLDVKRMKDETRRLMDDMGFTSKLVTPDTLVGKLSGGERQGVSITRALYYQAELIILDEPTMGLSLSEVRRVLEFVDGIRKRGKSCVFIDHNMYHVYPACDRLVVLDRGRIKGEFAKGDITLNELSEHLYNVARTGDL